MRVRAGLVMVLALRAAAAAADPDHMLPPAPGVEAVADTSRPLFRLLVTNNNRMGITVTNYGFIGNNFVSRSPSLEYPLGSGFEHMVRGGIWIGAQALDDSDRVFVGVTTGAQDGAQGGSSQSATEYSPIGTKIEQRSKLPNSQFFSRDAVSELDLIARYHDRTQPLFSPSTNEKHRPLNVEVRQENYMWSFADFQHFVVFHLTIKNVGRPLKNAWVGFYSELASGGKQYYNSWPPSSSASSLGSWYNKKLLAYDDSLRMFREHFCFAPPVPDNCRFSVVPYWIGIKLLGVHPGNLADISSRKVSLAAWSWAPGSPFRDQDAERYALMSSGMIQPLQGDSLLPQTGDPVELLAVGPFPEVAPDSSIVFDFAIVGGSDVPDLHRHAAFAQRAFDRDYIVPVPPPSPNLHVVARDHGVDLYWNDSPESFEDPTSPSPRDFEGYRVYLGEDRLDLKRVAQFDLATPPNDTTGFNTGFGAIRLPRDTTFDGVRYPYRYSVRALKNGFKYFTAVTAYDLGSSEIESLESGIAQNKTLVIPGPAAGERPGEKPVVFPNPYRVEARWDQGKLVRDHYLWFTNLPERCTLKIFTLSGDLVFESEFDGRSYHAEGSRGVYDPRSELDVDPPTLSGRTFGWNLITRQGQAAASGLYLFTVEDHGGGGRHVGKFLVVKSDREE